MFQKIQEELKKKLENQKSTAASIPPYTHRRQHQQHPQVYLAQKPTRLTGLTMENWSLFISSVNVFGM